MCTKYFVFQAYSAMLHRDAPKQRCQLPDIVSKFQIQTDNETWKGVKLIARQMFPTSGLTGIIYIIPQLWLKCSALCYLRLPQAPSWVLDLRGLRQRSAPHLSDRCLPPKQWIIVVLHLSGGTHLVWSAAFFLLFLVTAWHPQPAYPAPFFSFFFFPGHGTQMLCLCLTLSVCVCLFLFPALPFFSSDIFFPLSSLSLTKSPKSKEQADYVREKKRSIKVKGCVATRGIRAEVIYLPLVWCLTEYLPSSWYGIFPRPLLVFFSDYFHQSHSCFS